MGSQKDGQNLDFVGVSTGGRGARARRETMVTEPSVPIVPARAKGVPLETPEEDAGARAEREAVAKSAAEGAEQRLRERIREEIEAEVTAKVRAELEAKMKDQPQEGPALAKAGPAFKEIEPQAKASEKEQAEALEKNSQEVSD